MIKKFALLGTVGTLAFSGCDNKEPLIEEILNNQDSFENDQTLGNVIGFEFQGQAHNTMQRIYYLINADEDETTAEYVGFKKAVLSARTQDVGQAFNAKSTKMTKPISKWSKILSEFQRIQKEPSR